MRARTLIGDLEPLRRARSIYGQDALSQWLRINLTQKKREMKIRIRSVCPVREIGEKANSGALYLLNARKGRSLGSKSFGPKPIWMELNLSLFVSIFLLLSNRPDRER